MIVMRYAFALIVAAAFAVIIGIATRSVVAGLMGHLVGVFIGCCLARLMFPEDRRG